MTQLGHVFRRVLNVLGLSLCLLGSGFFFGEDGDSVRGTRIFTVGVRPPHKVYAPHPLTRLRARSVPDFGYIA